ncbi:MAG: four helix bundle protein [Bacteroidia bacterium]|nr:four helix bundle protein [Bacteroidia bacterium]
MAFRKLEIFKSAYELFIKTHRESFKLPKHEMYELGSQIRRSSESVVANIVEGYGRSRYKQEYIRFLVFSHSSNGETLLHLQEIIELYPEISIPFKDLHEQYDILGARINKYIQYVELKWNDFD